MKINSKAFHVVIFKLITKNYNNKKLDSLFNIIQNGKLSCQYRDTKHTNRSERQYQQIFKQ